MLLVVESAHHRSAVFFDMTQDSRMLFGLTGIALQEFRSELPGVVVSGGLLDCDLVLAGVVFGAFLLAAGLLVRFEVGLLAGTVTVGNDFAFVTGLEGFGGGGGFVAVGARVGSHDDAGERKGGVVVSFDMIRGVIYCVVKIDRELFVRRL